MTIYINSCQHLNIEEYPAQENEIINWLDSNIRNINQFYPVINGIQSLSYESSMNTTNGHILYDKDRLSYNTLIGIIYNKNKSLQQFVETLKNILKDDYNIDCSLNNFQPTDDVVTKTIKFQKMWKNFIVSKIIPFSEDLIVDTITYEQLCKLKNEETHMTNKEKLQKWVYDAAFELWNIPRSSINQEFFTNYIGQCDNININKILILYHQVTRFNHLMNDSLEENQSNFKHKMDWIRNQKDPNLDLYDKKNTEYYNKLIEAQTILELLCKRKEYINISQTSTPLVTFTRFFEYIKNMSNPKYEFILKLFEFKPKCWSGHENKAALANGDSRKRNAFIEKILKEIGLDIADPCKKNKKPGKDGYGSKIVYILPLVTRLKHVHHAGMFNNISNKVILINDDYIDPLDK